MIHHPTRRPAAVVQQAACWFPDPSPFLSRVSSSRAVFLFSNKRRNKSLSLGCRSCGRHAEPTFLNSFFPLVFPLVLDFSFLPAADNRVEIWSRFFLVVPSFSSCRSFVEDHLSLLFLRLWLCLKSSLVLFSASAPILSRNPCYSTCTDDAFLGLILSAS